MTSATPKLDQRRALGLKRYQERYEAKKEPIPKPQKIAEAKKAVEAVSQSNKSNAPQSNGSFDKAAYQRDYMRKRRAAKKTQKEDINVSPQE